MPNNKGPEVGLNKFFFFTFYDHPYNFLFKIKRLVEEKTDHTSDVRLQLEFKLQSLKKHYSPQHRSSLGL